MGVVRHRGRRARAVLLTMIVVLAGSVLVNSFPLHDSKSSIPPRLLNTGRDVGAVVRSLIAFQQWLLEHPDPARVAEIYGDDSAKGEHVKIAVQKLVDRQQRLECGSSPQVDIIDSDLGGKKGPDVVRVLAHVRRSPCRLLDSRNRALETHDGYQQRAFSYSLKTEDGKWYIIDDPRPR